MDPVSVFRTLWRQRWYVLPALVITLVAAGYVLQYGPRQYESTISYALVNPDVPTEAEMEAQPELQEVNSDNPFLRASNPTLITDVMVTRLSSADTADALEARGLSPDYTVARGGVGNGFVLDITGVGGNPDAARDTKAALGAMLIDDLRVVQEVNGADPSYHFKALLIADSTKATEQISSRLRTVIGTMLAGGILVFASVSFGEWAAASRTRRRRDRAEDRPAHGSRRSARGSTGRPSHTWRTDTEPTSPHREPDRPAETTTETPVRTTGRS
jgi:hypothetical protein